MCIAVPSQREFAPRKVVLLNMLLLLLQPLPLAVFKSATTLNIFVETKDHDLKTFMMITIVIITMT